MQKVMEDLFYGEIKCHQRYEKEKSFRAASLQADECIQKLEKSLDEDSLSTLHALENAHAQMNASTAIECYGEGFSDAARLVIALLCNGSGR